MANPLYGQNKADNKLDVLKNVGDGDFSDAKFLSRYLDYMAGYQGNLGTGIGVSDGEAVAGLATATAAEILACTLLLFNKLRILSVIFKKSLTKKFALKAIIRCGPSDARH